MKTGDKFLLLILAILVILTVETGIISQRSGVDKIIVIKSDGKTVKQIPLKRGISKSFEIKSREGHLTVEIKDGKVRVVNSTCKDKLCVKEGWIDKIGESIVCLPNRISISIASGGNDKIDTTTY